MFPRSPFAIRWYGNHVSISIGLLLTILVAVAATVLAYHPVSLIVPDVLDWSLASVLLAAGLIGSLLVHELGHVAASKLLGQHPNRTSISIFGGTEAGFDPPDHPRQEVLLALAGPVVSLATASVLGAVWLITPESPGRFSLLLPALVLANGALAVLNLLPGYPLDGGRIFRALVWYLHDEFMTGTRAAVVYGQVVSLAFLGAGVLLLGLQRPLAAWGLWLVLVGWSMRQTGRRELTRAFLMVAGSRLSAGETVEHLNPRVTSDQVLGEVVEVLLAEVEAGPAIVVTDGAVVGVITLDDIRRARRADWRRRTVSEAMRPVTGLPSIDQSVTVRDLMGYLAETDDGILLVTDDSRIVGAVDKRAALRRLFERTRARSQLRQR